MNGKNWLNNKKVYIFLAVSFIYSMEQDKAVLPLTLLCMHTLIQKNKDFSTILVGDISLEFLQDVTESSLRNGYADLSMSNKFKVLTIFQALGLNCNALKKQIRERAGMTRRIRTKILFFDNESAT